VITNISWATAMGVERGSGNAKLTFSAKMAVGWNFGFEEKIKLKNFGKKH